MTEKEKARLERERRRAEKLKKKQAGVSKTKKRTQKRKEIENFMKEIEANKKAQSISQAFLNKLVPPKLIPQGPRPPIGGIGLPNHLLRGPLQVNPYQNISQQEADRISTNLYVGNLPVEVKEADLMREFGKFGPIGSIKIMWPRTDEERCRQKHCGFVSFMIREHAEAALRNLGQSLVYGELMRITWGKPVLLPPIPLLNPFAPPPPPGTPVGIWPFDPPLDEDGVPPRSTRIKVQPPSDASVRKVIHLMAQRVIEGGMAFENYVISKERDVKIFSFLFHTNTPEHFYYRWKTISLAMGDTALEWSEKPFQLVERGQWWIPPKMASIAKLEGRVFFKKKGGARGSSSVDAKPLPEKQRNKFMNLLRQMSTLRFKVREGMAFCLDKAEYAVEITEIITESLTLPNTGAHKKLARLFLLSDILYNSKISSVKNSSIYRSEIQKNLPDIFESFAGCIRKQTDVKNKERLVKAVYRVLDVWREWAVFPERLVVQLRGAVNGAA